MATTTTTPIYHPTLPSPKLVRSTIFPFLFPECLSSTTTDTKIGTDAGGYTGTDTAQSILSLPPVSPNQIVQIDALTNRQLTRSQVLSNALRLASGLRSGPGSGGSELTQGKGKGQGLALGLGLGLGLKKGDVVGIVGYNSLEWMNAIYGSWAAGLRVSPVNYA